MVFLDWDRDECRHAPIFPGSFEEFAKPLKDGWLVIKYKEAPKSVLFVSNDRLERLPDTHGTLIENIRRAFQEDDDHERHSGCSGWRKRRRDFHPLHGSEVGGVAEAVPVLPLAAGISLAGVTNSPLHRKGERPGDPQSRPAARFSIPRFLRHALENFPASSAQPAGKGAGSDAKAVFLVEVEKDGQIPQTAARRFQSLLGSGQTGTVPAPIRQSEEGW